MNNKKYSTQQNLYSYCNIKFSLQMSTINILNYIFSNMTFPLHYLHQFEVYQIYFVDKSMNPTFVNHLFVNFALKGIK